VAQKYDLLLKKGAILMLGGLYGIVTQMRLLSQLGRGGVKVPYGGSGPYVLPTENCPGR
jgi:hypothetical protein